jgi:hypothetical protein
MRIAITVVLAVLAVALGALVGVLYTETETLRAQLAEQQTINKTLQAKIDADATKALAATLAPAPAKEAAPTEKSATAAPAAPAFDPSKLLEAMMAPKKDAGDGQAETDGAQNPMGDAMGMVSGLMENEAFSGQVVDMQVEMMYGGFLKDAGLTPEVREAVRAAIGESVGAMFKDSMSFLKDGDLTAMDDMAQNEEQRKAALREVLAQNLTPEQLAAYDTYEEELPRRMLEQSFDMQLSMMGGTMDEETRAVVRDTLVETLLPLQEDASLKPSESMSQSTAAMEQALDRLEGLLPPDQYESAARFIQQQVGMMQGFEEMLPGASAAE